MRNLIGPIILLLAIILNSGCKKSCLDCTIEHFDDLSLVATVNGICGNDNDLEQEQNRLSIDYRCIQCIVFGPLGDSDTGIICGDAAFTDSVQTSNEEAAYQIGAGYSCELFTDTLIIRCYMAD